MSGICGVVNLDGSPVERATLEAMAEAAKHRAPDGVRHHAEGPAGLSHLALDTTPEDSRERQPIADGKLALTADARVDNREELLRSLRLPKSSTDAEIILASYRRWGEGCAERLVGDFAFCVWDSPRGRLFAARDAMAMRSLHYRAEGRRFLFGTEAKQVLAAPGVPRRVSEPAVGAYLSGCFGPLESSFYEGIEQLAPGHSLVADAGGVRVWRHWEPDEGVRIEYSSEDEYAEHFREVFTESVRARMRSAKPVGLFLSGGMDSGSVASVAGRMARLGGVSAPSFRAYSWAFDDFPECDERHISRGITGRYRIPDVDVPVSEGWPLKDYPAHGPDADEPYIGVYQALIERALAMARSDGTGVVLSGDRGDLMVGDIAFDHMGLLRAGRFGELRAELAAHSRSHGASFARMAFHQLVGVPLRNKWPRAMEFTRALRGSKDERRDYFPGWVRPEFARRIGLEALVRDNEEPTPPGGDPVRDDRYKLIFMHMHMKGMAWSERTWSRFGQSFADPWSDRRLAELVLAMPQWRVQSVRERKRIARVAMRGVIPDGTMGKISKISPAPLYERALREWAADTIEDLITDSHAAARGFLDEEILQKHYRAVRRGETEDPRIWWALTLEMWLRQHWSGA